MTDDAEKARAGGGGGEATVGRRNKNHQVSWGGLYDNHSYFHREDCQYQYQAHMHSVQGVLRKPLFEMRWFYIGIAQIALVQPAPAPPLKRANVGKSAPNQEIHKSIHFPDHLPLFLNW